MAVAAAASSETKSSPVSLWFASMVGGVYLLGALAVVLVGVPHLWHIGVSPWLAPAVTGLADAFLLIVAEMAALALLVVFGINLAGTHPPKGLRGGIFLAVATIVTGFFLLRGVLAILEQMARRFEFPQVIGLALLIALGWFFWKFVKSDRMTRWSVKLEDAGWFEGRSYKRSQGIRVRRFTILGLLLLFGSGVYTMMHNHVVADGDWLVSIPFANVSMTLLPNLRLTIPAILIFASLWFAWRVVNFPVFADFLIATEAEINKVSWTPRARLIQDTIVVLITVVIITLFLFVVDIFWGIFLSRSFINVLPSDSDSGKNPTKQATSNEW